MLEGDALPAAEAARPCFCCGATVPADLRCYCRMCGDARPLDDRCPCGRPSTSMDVRACDAWVARWEPGAPVDRSAHLTSVALDAELALVNDRGGVIAGMSRAIERKLGTLLRERTEARAERDAARQALADAAVQWQRSSADLAGELARLRGIETACRAWAAAHEAFQGYGHRESSAEYRDAEDALYEADRALTAALDAPRPTKRLDARYFVTVARMVLDPVDHRARHAIDCALDALALPDGPEAAADLVGLEALDKLARDDGPGEVAR